MWFIDADAFIKSPSTNVYPLFAKFPKDKAMFVTNHKDHPCVPTEFGGDWVQIIFFVRFIGSLQDIDNAGHNVPGDNPEAFESTVKRFLA